MFNLRRDPFERAEYNSNTYFDWIMALASRLQHGAMELLRGTWPMSCRLRSSTSMASGAQRDSGSTTTSSSTHRVRVVKALLGRRSVDDAAGI
jgi:hypothetical protein